MGLLSSLKDETKGGVRSFLDVALGQNESGDVVGLSTRMDINSPYESSARRR